MALLDNIATAGCIKKLLDVEVGDNAVWTNPHIVQVLKTTVAIRAFTLYTYVLGSYIYKY
jgi:hypothetical protein